MATMTALSEAVKHAAAEAGFELAGVAAVGEFPELDYFPEWLSAGYGGEMKYLEARDEAGRLKRASLNAVAPWARSVVVCAKNYNTSAPYSVANHAGKVPAANSAQPRGNEFPEWMDLALCLEPGGLPRFGLAAAPGVEAGLRQVGGPEIRDRSYVDTGPLVERGVRECAGVGWTGKNAVIIDQNRAHGCFWESFLPLSN